MKKTVILGFPMGIIIGVIFGALIDNMAIGILLGLALGCGVWKFGDKVQKARTENESDDPASQSGDMDDDAPRP